MVTSISRIAPSGTYLPRKFNPVSPCPSIPSISFISVSPKSEAKTFNLQKVTLFSHIPKTSITMDNREESIRRLMKLKLLLAKLQRRFRFLSSRKNDLSDIDEEENIGREMVPKDAKKGHFAVVAVKGRQPKKFVVELENLSNPEFISLLEQAKEEYGFRQKGVIAVPCLPEELQDVISSRRHRRMSTEW